eukprot:3267625-Karenia_brevis.AAC.1
MSSWMKGCRDFVNATCKRWHLPQLPERDIPPSETAAAGEDWRKRGVIIPLWHPRLQTWTCSHKCITFQVDCKALADLLCGQAVLDDDSLRPMFVRMARGFARLIDAGWATRSPAAGFVEWAPRKYNVVADHIANVTMDRGQDWQLIRPQSLRESVEAGCNILVCSDGGKRETAASAAWIAYACSLTTSSEYRFQILGQKGSYLQSCTSAFLAEALALEDAINSICRLIIS